MSVSFFSLPPHDVVFPLIFRPLDAVHVWRLRLVSKQFRQLCEDYFQSFCRVVRYSEPLHAAQTGNHDSLPLNSISTGNSARWGALEEDVACIVHILKACTKLEHLSLKLHSEKPPSESSPAQHHHHAKLAIRSVLLSTLSHAHFHLTHLTLQNLNSTGEFLPRINGLTDQCCSLRELHIEEMPLFDDECLYVVTRNCQHLVTLTLKALTQLRGANLDKLADRCSHLKKLNFSGSWNIETKNLERMLHKVPELEELKLSSMFSAVTDGTILIVKEYCAHLQSLCLTQCSRVSERFLIPLVQRGVCVEGIPAAHRKNSFSRTPGQI